MGICFIDGTSSIIIFVYRLFLLKNIQTKTVFHVLYKNKACNLL